MKSRDRRRPGSTIVRVGGDGQPLSVAWETERKIEQHPEYIGVLCACDTEWVIALAADIRHGNAMTCGTCTGIVPVCIVPRRPSGKKRLDIPRTQRLLQKIVEAAS